MKLILHYVDNKFEKMEEDVLVSIIIIIIIIIIISRLNGSIIIQFIVIFYREYYPILEFLFFTK